MLIIIFFYLIWQREKQRSYENTSGKDVAMFGSRFLNGTPDIHIQLEERLADLVGSFFSWIIEKSYRLK